MTGSRPVRFTDESMRIKIRRPGLATLVLLGFMLGIFCGVFLGELAAVFEPFGRAYVRLLQMAIIPYIMVSLIAGLGRLTPQQASRIALWGGAALLLVLGLGMMPVLLVPLAYPDWEAANYFSSNLANHNTSLDFVDLFIPANPFKSLADTIVPAVVIFSIVMGVAVMTSKRKAPLITLLMSMEEALMNVSRFVVRLAPIGIFAIAANSAGTLDVADFGKLQVYFWSYLLLWAIMFFVLLPGLLIALTPIRYRELFSAFRIPFVTAFVTGSILIVLPMMIEEVHKLLRSHELGDEELEATVEVLIPTAFNFPSVAMVLGLSFVIFSGWYAGSPVTVDRYPMFASVGILVAFGGSSVAMPFLLDLFHLPADMFDLFVTSSVITKSFRMALSAMSLAVVTLLAVCLIRKVVSPKPILLAGLIAFLLVGVPLLMKTSAVVMDRAIPYEYHGYTDFINRDLMNDSVDIRPVDYQAELREPIDIPDRLTRIGSSGWLRVGYSPDSLPWAFRNGRGRVVGFDIELLHRMAREFGVGIELMRVEIDQVGHALASNQIDIYASGLMIDALRVRNFSFSRPYSEVTLGLLVEDHRRQEFESVEKLSGLDAAKFAVLQSPSLLRALELSVPGHRFLHIDSPRDFLEGELPQIDALFMSAEAASAWTLVFPKYSAVLRKPGRSIPIVFGLPQSDETFRSFVDNWIQSSKALGVMDTAYDRWILGHETVESQPRWSIIRDVLHWVE